MAEKLTIESKLAGKTFKEKANIKGDEISKLSLVGEYINSTYGVRVDIQSIEKIEGGVMVTAKAWRNSEQLGFGDGSVEIERFKIFNPPILVYTSRDVVKEDPLTAIKDSLAHTVSITGKTGTKITLGKVGNTVATFYPASGSNTPVNGRIYVDNNNFSTARNASTGDVAEVDPVISTLGVDRFGGGPTFEILRGFFLYDTSSLGSGSTVSSAVHSFNSDGPANGNADSSSMNTIETNPAATNTLATTDYGSVTFTNLGSIALSSVASGYNDMTLNATGISKISLTGITKFGIINSLDLSNTTPSGRNAVNCYFARQSGTSQDPKLVVTYTAAASANGNFLNFM